MAQRFTLVEQIVDNLHLVIHNVHIRYEDVEMIKDASDENVEESNKDKTKKHAMGITMAELSVRSTDSLWNITYVQNQQVGFGLL